MKRFIIVLIIISPYLLMVTVNEIYRPYISDTSGKILGVSSMNSLNPITNHCTIACQHNTTFCRHNHVKFVKPGFPFFNKINKLYWGIIDSLNNPNSKNILDRYYVLTNIIFLVVLWPAWMLYLFIRIIYHKK